MYLIPCFVIPCCLTYKKHQWLQCHKVLGILLLLSDCLDLRHESCTRRKVHILLESHRMRRRFSYRLTVMLSYYLQVCVGCTINGCIVKTYDVS